MFARQNEDSVRSIRYVRWRDVPIAPQPTENEIPLCDGFGAVRTPRNVPRETPYNFCSHPSPSAKSLTKTLVLEIDMDNPSERNPIRQQTADALIRHERLADTAHALDDRRRTQLLRIVHVAPNSLTSYGLIAHLNLLMRGNCKTYLPQTDATKHVPPCGHFPGGTASVPSVSEVFCNCLMR